MTQQQQQQQRSVTFTESSRHSSHDHSNSAPPTNRRLTTSERPRKRKSSGVLAAVHYLDIDDVQKMKEERAKKRRRVDEDPTQEKDEEDDEIGVVASETARGASSSSSEATHAEAYAVLLSCISGGSRNKITARNVWHQSTLFNIKSIARGTAKGEEVDFQLAAQALDVAGQMYTTQVDDTYKASFELMANLVNKEKQKQNEESKELTRQQKRRDKSTLAENPSQFDLKEEERSYVSVRFHHGIPNFEISRPDCALSRILNMDRKGNLILDRQNFYPFTSSANPNASSQSAPNNTHSTSQSESGPHGGDRDTNGELQFEEHMPTLGTQSATQGCDVPPNWGSNAADHSIGVDIRVPLLSASTSFHDNSAPNENVLHPPLDMMPPPSPTLDNLDDDDDDDEEAPTFDNHEFHDQIGTPGSEPPMPPPDLHDGHELAPVDINVPEERDAFGYFKNLSMAPLKALRTISKISKGTKRVSKKQEQVINFDDFARHFDPDSVKIPTSNTPTTLQLKENTLHSKKQIDKLDIITIKFDFTRDLLTPFNFSVPLDRRINRQNRQRGQDNAPNGASVANDNQQDNQDLPELPMLPDMDDIHAGDIMDEIEDHQYNEREFYIDRPEEIGNLNIGFAKRRKKVDVAGVKMIMQGEIEDHNSNKTFSNLIQKARKETGGDSDNISVGMSFICLLHLTNQHGYVLKQHEPFGDFSVEVNAELSDEEEEVLEDDE
mmetsp:Transcript_10015/g.37386  ORF Transcript_10015/g.37386 Transcript_10015/m.37386 type:complete len:722 (-) Transcript_10015:4824-6989(-)|eukprot:CAMPEP_0117438890 /NCGR_PEP_ID=MMETSP0759-20121206/2287_1 /TAXON_ID=63605 /ORGANISM="Percolomonas cosmopolitus, Strain WS" /LENGTH=721 /DNA_ID=CAMNT_0005230597 /DNA_START=320 /DNA_END=2485 /DNA_ORIENTATION=+